MAGGGSSPWVGEERLFETGSTGIRHEDGEMGLWSYFWSRPKQPEGPKRKYQTGLYTSVSQGKEGGRKNLYENLRIKECRLQSSELTGGPSLRFDFVRLAPGPSALISLTSRRPLPHRLCSFPLSSGGL